MLQNNGILYIIQIWWIPDGVFCDRPAVSQLALAESFAHRTGTGRLTS